MAELRIQIDDDLLLALEESARTHGRLLDAEVASLLRAALPQEAMPRETFAAAAKRIAAMTPKGVKQTDSVKILRAHRDGTAIEE